MKRRLPPPTHISHCISDVYRNKALLFVISTFIVLALQYGVFWKEITETSTIHYLIVALGDIALILLPYWFLKGKWRASIWIPIIGFNIYWIGNIIYFRTYSDLIPLSSLSLVDNVDGVVADSIKNSFKIKDSVYPLGIILLAVLWHKTRRDVFKARMPRSLKIWAIIITLIWNLLTHIYREYDYYLEYIFIHTYQQKHSTKLQLILKSYPNSWGEFEGCVSKKRKFYTFGAAPHLFLSIAHELKTTKPLTEDEKSKINMIISQNRNSTTATHSTQFKNSDKNLIIIIVESLNSWVLDFEIDGKSVVPNLRDLMMSGDAIVATDLISQAGPGRSSDGQLLINTGLLPLRNEATVSRHSGNNFPSIAKAIGSRPKFEVICEEKSLWRHGITSKKEGYDHIYDITDSKAAGLTSGPVEETMFQLAESVIDKTEQPFFCTLITLAMHGPYNAGPKWKSWISEAAPPNDLTTYLEATHYFDTELGKFIDYLKANGIFDNSVIVITSDHESAVPGYKGSGVGTVPFIALNAGLDTVITRRGGQIDIFPTIIDIIGASDYWWKGLGTSLIAESGIDGALDRFGKPYGNLNDRQLNDYRDRWEASELIIRHDFFKDKE